ncbi:MAG: ATP-dependent DNA helicase [Lachnospiraceae bacterium]|nr:ATP-dependent DNA helicase [Lachnospiraceae bacterium]
MEIKISVRNLVEFIMKSGDIDNRGGSLAEKDAMQAGSRLHRKIQRQMGAGYRAEVKVSERFAFDRYQIWIEGRADGIFEEENISVIDEIKGIYKDLRFLTEPAAVHQAQAMCYAYFYAKQNQKETMRVQLTYVHIPTENIRRFQKEYSFEALEEWFELLLTEYRKWADYQIAAEEERNRSIKKIEFPFVYRPGQRDLAVSVYRTIAREKTLFIQAPTGVGKTISAIFPAVKAVGEQLGEKIFYLTAKTITRTVAEEAFDSLRKQGLSFKTVTITAKEKICFMKEKDCNPTACPYAQGHYDRVNDAVYDLLVNEESINREKIEAYAGKHRVCPFEMCLDVTNWVDGIICDYNYVFDPSVRLRRYFAEGSGGDYLFLVDEAHNLIERAREMFSASLVKEEFLSIKRQMVGYSDSIIKDLEKCNRIFLEWKRSCEGYEILPNAGVLVDYLMQLTGDIENFLEEQRQREFAGREALLEFYFQVKKFLAIQELVDESYRIYTEHTEDGMFRIKLYCIHTAHNLQECLKKGRSTIFFSATLLPILYYRELLSGNPEDYAIYAESPFQQEKRLLLAAADVSSRYTQRTDSEYRRIAAYIRAVTESRIGNYMVFFPSYSFLEQTVLFFQKQKAETTRLVLQSSNMSEQKKEEFLAAFKEEAEKKQTLVGFCVLGGSFSEGIDLKAEQLIGTVIVGTGLPQICNERKILKEYYDERGENGFNFAYRFPGMNKVLQAAGRVIRTDEDRGVILLLDNRFFESANRVLFPKEWSDFRQTRLEWIEGQIETFWKEQTKGEG